MTRRHRVCTGERDAVWSSVAVDVPYCILVARREVCLILSFFSTKDYSCSACLEDLKRGFKILILSLALSPKVQ